MDYMTISEVARVLGCSKQWLYEAERKGLIPVVQRDGRGWRIYTPKDVTRLKKLFMHQEGSSQSKISVSIKPGPMTPAQQHSWRRFWAELISSAPTERKRGEWPRNKPQP